MWPNFSSKLAILLFFHMPPPYTCSCTHRYTPTPTPNPPHLNTLAHQGTSRPLPFPADPSVFDLASSLSIGPRGPCFPRFLIHMVPTFTYHSLCKCVTGTRHPSVRGQPQGICHCVRKTCLPNEPRHKDSKVLKGSLRHTRRIFSNNFAGQSLLFF